MGDPEPLREESYAIIMIQNSNQVTKSSLIPEGTLILCLGLLTPIVASMSLLIKALPDATTWLAKFNNPIIDCKSRNVVLLVLEFASVTCQFVLG